MKIVRFVDEAGAVRYGELLDERRAWPLDGGLFGRRSPGAGPVGIRRLLAPVEPPNIFAIGLNYRDHAAEGGGRALPERPLIFSKATTAVIGPDEPIVLPVSAPDEVDLEGELGIVIGHTAKNVSESAAGNFIFGFTCVNDVTARDCQNRIDRQWTRAKGFDTFCPVGPCIVTADEFDPAAATVLSFLNDQPMQSGRTADMIFDCACLVSYLSRQFTLLPGTLICTGTPAGVGVWRTPPIFLRPGDRVCVRIPGIGDLSNPVQAA